MTYIPFNMLLVTGALGENIQSPKIHGKWHPKALFKKKQNNKSDQIYLDEIFLCGLLTVVPWKTLWVGLTFADGLQDKIRGFCEGNIISAHIVLFICLKEAFLNAVLVESDTSNHSPDCVVVLDSKYLSVSAC